MECIILGNGKSLLTAVLPDLPAYGCNYIGKLIQPTYYVCIDASALKHDDLIYPTARDAKIAFLRDFNTCDPKPHPLYSLPNVSLVTKKSYTWKGESTTTGGTTTYLMLKIALSMGFTTVYLYGVDHTTEHFTEDWLPGVKPDLQYREKHYRIAAREYKLAGGKIINRSSPSILDEIFASL
jgi:hypothetical protein